MKELTLQEFDAMFAIMEASFPKSEMRTYEEQKKLFEREDYHVYGFYQQDVIIGFLAIYDETEFVFIEHFALASAFRGQGYGSQILQQWIASLEKPSVFEVEYPETEMAKRRIQLYQRLGANLYDQIDYVMPPLHADDEPLPLYLMSFTKDLKEVDMRKMIPAIYEHVYRVKLPFGRIKKEGNKVNRKELAIQLYKKGYSCAQAVACAYHDELQMNSDDAYRLSEGFGGGMGHYGHTCGACSAMVMVAGGKLSNGVNDLTSKQKTYPLVKEMVEQFVTLNGYLNCFDILKHGSSEMEDNKRVCCIQCICSACDILDQMIANQNGK